MTYIHLVATALLLAGPCIADLGFDLFFRTNLDEMSNSPITFDKPLPSWLKGSLVRNGIGRFEIGHRGVTTALDAYAKLSKWTFSGSNTTNQGHFSTKFVESDSYVKSVRAGDIVPYMMLAPANPPFEPWQIMESMFYGADNMNVNVFNYGDGQGGDGYVLTSDFWNVYHADFNSLKTIGPIKPPIAGAPSYEQVITLGSAHALPENGTNNHITFATLASALPTMKSKYMLYRATSVSDRKLFAEIEVDSASYLHSFALSANYMILVTPPLFIDPMRILRKLDPVDAFKWVPTESTKMYVVDLFTGFVKRFETENFFFLHHINSFEENGQINIDLCTYKDGDTLHIMDLKNLKNATTRSFFKKPTIKRYTINLRDNTVNVNTFPSPNPKIPFASTIDFPTINENYRYKKYCYTYGVAYSAYSTDFLDMALVKKDLCTGKNDAFWYKAGSYFNEAFFVPRPGAVDEDDGVLLVDVLDTQTKESKLVIFDAKTLTIGTSALLPTNNPFGTHGRFFPEVV